MGEQMTERDPMLRREVDKEMNLPENKTCSDCYHFRRCNAIFGHIAKDEVCDWSPSRFYDVSNG